MAELMVVGFEGKHRAVEVLNQLTGISASYVIELEDAVAVYRTDDGTLRVDESVRPTTKDGAAAGALLGGVIGAILMAPLTAGLSAAAAAGTLSVGALSLGATGAVFGADDAARVKEATGITEAYVQEVGGMVQPGQSAVFVLATVSDPAKVAEAMRGYGGKVLRTTIAPDAAAKFQQMMMTP